MKPPSPQIITLASPPPNFKFEINKSKNDNNKEKTSKLNRYHNFDTVQVQEYKKQELIISTICD